MNGLNQVNEWVKIFAEISEFAISHLQLWVAVRAPTVGTKCSVIDFQNVQMQKFSRIFLTWMRYGGELKLEKRNVAQSVSISHIPSGWYSFWSLDF